MPQERNGAAHLRDLREPGCKGTMMPTAIIAPDPSLIISTPNATTYAEGKWHLYSQMSFSWTTLQHSSFPDLVNNTCRPPGRSFPSTSSAVKGCEKSAFGSSWSQSMTRLLAESFDQERGPRTTRFAISMSSSTDSSFRRCCPGKWQWSMKLRAYSLEMSASQTCLESARIRKLLEAF